MKKATIGLILLGIATSIIIGLYFFRFNGELSYNQTDWNAFGGYIGGIAAIINVGVFIWLTISIQNASSKQREKELYYQRQIVISQMRQAELMHLQKILFTNGSERYTTKEKFINELMLDLTTSISTLEAFRKQKIVLFPILQSCGNITNSLLNIYRTDVGYIMNLPVDYDMNSITGNLQITDRLNLEAELLTILQNFIIDNINDK